MIVLLGGISYDNTDAFSNLKYIVSANLFFVSIQYYWEIPFARIFNMFFFNAKELHRLINL